MVTYDNTVELLFEKIAEPTASMKVSFELSFSSTIRYSLLSIMTIFDLASVGIVVFILRTSKPFFDFIFCCIFSSISLSVGNNIRMSAPRAAASSSDSKIPIFSSLLYAVVVGRKRRTCFFADATNAWYLFWILAGS